MGAPVAGDYPATVKISEGNVQCREETAPKLEIDKPLELSNIALVFNHIDTYRFVLSKKPCEVGDATNK